MGLFSHDDSKPADGSAPGAPASGQTPPVPPMGDAGATTDGAPTVPPVGPAPDASVPPVVPPADVPAPGAPADGQGTPPAGGVVPPQQ